MNDFDDGDECEEEYQKSKVGQLLQALKQISQEALDEVNAALKPQEKNILSKIARKKLGRMQRKNDE